MQGSISKSAFLWMIALAAAVQLFAGGTAEAQQPRKPNILVLFGDDIGYWNVSAYNHGIMGYRTPNIDRIAKEGRDLHRRLRAAELHRRPRRVHHRSVADSDGPPQGRTAERARGPREKDPTIAEMLKGQGYTSGQFGKNHLGDRNEFIPTVHGFDEFLGNFYHLNAEEEPENPDYPKDPAFKARFGPRGVFHCYATATVSTLPDDPRFGKWGKQRCEDTGPLTKKRMETVDEEVLAATLKFIDTNTAAGKPWFTWFNTTRMHINTHLKPASVGKTGLGVEADGMVEHDGMIGELLKKVDELEDRRQHHRHLHHRQRRRGVQLA